jgi:hypothetical protein
MRTKHTFRLPPDLAGQLAGYASRKRVPQALVVETALVSLLSPDGANRLEAALARRLDTAQAAAQTKGRERYDGFLEALGRRLARGRTLADEVVRDIPAESDSTPEPDVA